MKIYNVSSAAMCAQVKKFRDPWLASLDHPDLGIIRELAAYIDTLERQALAADGRERDLHKKLKALANLIGPDYFDTRDS